MIDEGVQWVRSRLGAGRRVLIHCEHGIGRSALLALCVLVAGGIEPLDAMNRIGDCPWALTFSYGRALQAAPQKAWAGKAENVANGQRAFAHRAAMNSLAATGQWKQDLEKKAA